MNYYLSIDDSSNAIMHHGRKGMKWGVRNGPPYPIEDNVLKKGTKLANISANPNKKKQKMQTKGKWLYTYNPDDPWDSKVYKGPFSRLINARLFGNTDVVWARTYEHTYQVVKDLKMPTSKERKDAFIEVFKNTPEAVNELKSVQQILQKWNLASKHAQTIDFSKISSKEDYDAAYEVFNHAMENVNGFSVTKAYAKYVSTRWDAMVDDNNVNVYNEAHDPIIVFNSDKVLKMKSVKINSVPDIIKNTDDIEETLAKKGKKVLL